MAKIHRYTMAHAKTEFGHMGKVYNEQQIRELVDQAYNDVENNMENIEDMNNHEEWIEANEGTEEVLVENGNTLDVDNIVDLCPWVVIEAWEGEREEESESEDDNDYDPVEIAQRFVESSEQLSELPEL